MGRLILRVGHGFFTLTRPVAVPQRRAFLFSMEYAELLKHPFWQKKRLLILNRDDWKCRRCTDHLSNLQIHHLYYDLSLNPWEYPDDSLITLCDLCHLKAEFINWFRRFGIRQLVQQGFLRSDVMELKEMIERRVETNMHRPTVTAYMKDLKILING